jgi:UDP-N-acetylmuramyl pentapeptide phosphotransferase/UDP-N-acetylglucosamine-1-phosphate transferase
VWFVPLTFSPFVLDATITLTRRVLAGKKPWIAHREHLYQRLILGGWSHRRLALFAYALMATVAAGALLALRHRDEIQSAIIIADLLFLAGCFWMAERYLKSHTVAP